MVDGRNEQVSGAGAQPNAQAAVVAIETTVTAEDMGAAWAYVPLFRAGRMAYLFMTLIGIGFILALVRHGEIEWIAVLGMVLGNLAVLWLGVSMKRGWMRAADQSSGPARFRFDEAGFEWETPIRCVRLAWAAVPHYVETPQSFLVYTAGHGFALLPKRARDVGELDAVRRILANRVARKPRRGIARPLVVGLIVVIFLVVWQAIESVSDDLPVDDTEPSTPAEVH